MIDTEKLKAAGQSYLDWADHIEERVKKGILFFAPFDNEHDIGRMMIGAAAEIVGLTDEVEDLKRQLGNCLSSVELLAREFERSTKETVELQSELDKFHECESTPPFRSVCSDNDGLKVYHKE